MQARQAHEAAHQPICPNAGVPPSRRPDSNRGPLHYERRGCSPVVIRRIEPPRPFLRPSCSIAFDSLACFGDHMSGREQHGWRVAHDLSKRERDRHRWPASWKPRNAGGHTGERRRRSACRLRSWSSSPSQRLSNGIPALDPPVADLARTPMLASLIREQEDLPAGLRYGRSSSLIGTSRFLRVFVAFSPSMIGSSGAAMSTR